MPADRFAAFFDPANTAGAPVSDYVPLELDGTVWANLEPLYTGLLERDIESEADFETWLLDRSELDAQANESRANLYVAMTCHTDDPETAGAWTAFLDEVPPKWKPVTFALNQMQAALFERYALDPSRFGEMRRRTLRSVEMFREENVDIETQIAKLDQEYDTVCGAMTVEFDGDERTMPQMAKYMQDPDRSVREAAWRATTDRRLRDKDTISDIFEKMLKLRQKAAENAGYDNFRDYQHAKMERFDYTPDDCVKFHEGVAEHVVPFMHELDKRREANMGVDILRPWDLNADEKGRAPLRPFETGQELIEKSRRVFHRLDSQLAGFFDMMGDDVVKGGENFDLDSRKGKASGGYQYMRDRSRMPFIFMNAAGLHRDVETMVHEAGHAFHSFLCLDEPVLQVRDYATEIAEVASMSMELLTMPYWDEYYPSQSDADRARRGQLEGSVTMLCWIATIDAFQHWLYTNPGHTREDRAHAWLDISRRFGHDVSWNGLLDSEQHAWQRQGHLFGVPFYYIEYGIAQLGALGIYQHALERGEAEALTLYKKSMSMGGRAGLPTLFAAADLPFRFDSDRIGDLVQMVRGELAKLPE